MNHAQIVLNDDGTFCLDVYREGIEEKDVKEAALAIDLIMQNSTNKIRSTPFRVGKCSHCGHYILTNRDQDATITCKNCGNETLIEQGDSEKEKAFTQGVNTSKGTIFVNATGDTIHILVFLPELEDSELVSVLSTLDYFGFKADHSNDPVYAQMRLSAHEQNLDKKAKTILKGIKVAKDGEFFNGFDSSLVESVRIIKNINRDIEILSMVS